MPEDVISSTSPIVESRVDVTDAAYYCFRSHFFNSLPQVLS